MDINNDTFNNLQIIKLLCIEIIDDQKNSEQLRNLQKLKEIVEKCTNSSMKIFEKIILSTIYFLMQKVAKNKSCFNSNDKQLIVDTMKVTLDKIIVENVQLFYNIYGFLLFEIYDQKEHKILPISEEYKMSILECLIALVNALADTEIIFDIYAKINVSKFSQMIYVLLELLKNEKYKKLRLKTIDALMAIARIQKNDDCVLRMQIADLFIFFLPGIASTLRNVAMENEKIGHKIPAMALKCWSKIVVLLMENHNKNSLDDNNLSVEISKLKMDENLENYLENTKRTNEWFKKTDEKLREFIGQFIQLTYHSHSDVREELLNLTELIIENCISTMPISIAQSIEILIVLSEDENEKISYKSAKILENLSQKFTNDKNSKNLFEQLEESFFNLISSLPRKFNGIDEKQKLMTLNLLIGYLNLFGKHKLEHILLSYTHLNRLTTSLIHISQIEKKEVSLLEEYITDDMRTVEILGEPWKKFAHFNDDSIRLKLEHICLLLGKLGASEIISDIFLDNFLNNPEIKKEVTFLMNHLIMGLNPATDDINVIKNIFELYTEKHFWYLSLDVGINDYGVECKLGDVQENIIQICLQIEGIGRMATVLQSGFQPYLLKSFYLILERAGCGQPLIKLSGLKTLLYITNSFGYKNFTELITKNMDYFAFYIERKLKKIDENESVLNVLSVIMKYTNIEILHTLTDIVNETLMQSCDKYQEKNSLIYLKIFQIFIESLYKWLNIEIDIKPLKTKQEKLDEIEHFQVNGIDLEQKIDDSVLEKSPEEIIREDLQKNPKELEDEINNSEDSEYKKPEPPLHVKLTASILLRSLNFLPSKDRQKKILVLNILKNGLEIIRDWEDELLPIVHKIWSPLIVRFYDLDEHLIINYSFQLLIVLGRLSKDFIRSRTSKEVLPNLLKCLENLWKKSYLKDKGAEYRYTQSYKLQLILLENLGRFLLDLDVIDADLLAAMDVVFPYLSNKQPTPLQKAAIKFFLTLKHYDQQFVFEKLNKEKIDDDYCKNYEIIINQ